MTTSLWVAFWALLSAGVVIVGWDIYTVLKNGKTTSVTDGVRVISNKYLIIPYALGMGAGVLVGHLFWSGC